MKEHIRVLIVLTICARLYFAVQNSYLHPDEHFQNFSIINSILHPNTAAAGDIPWEFQGPSPARSLIPLYLVYYPLFWYSPATITPIQQLYLVRLMFCFVSWIVVDYSMIRLASSSTRKNLTWLALSYTSYITWTYQSHTFSNSIETWVLCGCLMVIDSIKTQMENYQFVKSQQKSQDIKEESPLKIDNNYGKLSVLAVLVVFGMFNRITFAAFLVLPGIIYLGKFFFQYKKFLSLMVFIMVCGLTIAGFGYGDTILFEHFHPGYQQLQYNFQYQHHKFIIPPLNNLIYNSEYTNLAKHGIHSRITHLFINLPQMLGPLYLICIVNFKNYFQFARINFQYLKNWATNTPNHSLLKQMQTNEQYQDIMNLNVVYLTIVSGMSILSLVPHQELRFIVCLQPLFLKIMDFEFLHEQFVTKTEKADDNKKENTFFMITSKSKTLVRNILWVWYVYNAILGTLMGVFHQGGVITALDHLREQYSSNNGTIGSVQVWWRTYSPPTWLLGDAKPVIVLKYDDLVPVDGTTEHDDNLRVLLEYDYLAVSNSTVVVDVMGMDIDKLYRLLDRIVQTVTTGAKDVQLVAPVGSMDGKFTEFYKNSRRQFQWHEVWGDFWHIDMDHLEPGQYRPGIGVYSIV
ncbi:glycosylphosphatidylinositol-alpha 1,2 mannosyltransferase [Saccharomycopsis crataegensis]|uniref:Mannosyltransferase n=1 Tax=Saccharomycopsis crataegensis TaxID=43959 RepID=A0AAV5QGB1_9ASCO|nr:glycosylphosphatidylinositol-alpha 1,2 mannosyltransferase [Saccharomycopsis crataegensis]